MNDRRPLLLGEAPSRVGDRYHYFPLSGAPAKRLCEWAGIPACDEEGRACAPYWALIERFDTLNAIERYADAYPWSVRRARERWTLWLLTEAPPGPLTVVCLGRKAAAAVGVRGDRPWGKWFEAGLLRTVVLPHPSLRCREYNDPSMRQLAGRVLREAMAFAGGAR